LLSLATFRLGEVIFVFSLSPGLHNRCLLPELREHYWDYAERVGYDETLS
jgi:hypothetical protein